jgi:hypothetical protein
MRRWTPGEGAVHSEKPDNLDVVGTFVANRGGSMGVPGNAFLFDLDGTLVDSVYQHVLAWHQALQAEHIELSIWRIHRKIGMSGGLFADQLLREIHGEVTPAMIKRLGERHAGRQSTLRTGIICEECDYRRRYRGPPISYRSQRLLTVSALALVDVRVRITR